MDIIIFHSIIKNRRKNLKHKGFLLPQQKKFLRTDFSFCFLKINLSAPWLDQEARGRNEKKNIVEAFN